jgi:predicted metal-dependent enzyme (double-stranded beta helix superfamily)
VSTAENFVRDCQSAITESDPIKAVQQAMQAAIIDPEPWLAAMAKQKDGVISLSMNDDLTALQVSTEPEIKSPIHNHLTWVVIGMYAGEEHNYFYQRNDAGLELVEEKTLRAGDVYVMDANAIHAIKNPKSSVNGALHVYGGSLMTRPGRSFWHPDSGEELPYDYEQVIAFSRKC